MNKIFDRLTLPVKLTLIAIIPLLFLVFLTVRIQQHNDERMLILNKFRANVSQAGQAVTLADELQTERRASFRYAMTGLEGGALQLQRPKTDAAIAELDQADASIRFAQFRSYTFLDRLDSFRSRLDKGEVQAMEVMNYYTNVLFRINTLTPVYTENVPYLEPVANNLRAMRLATEMITYFGITRGTVYQALYLRQDPKLTVEQIRSLHDIYKSFETEFYVKAPQPAVAAYKKMRTTGALGLSLGILDRSIKAGSLDASMEAEAWWDVSVKGIDELKSFQREKLRDVIAQVDSIHQKEKSDKNRNLIILIVMIGLVVFLVLFTINNISSSLTRLRIAAQKIAVGETGLDLGRDTNDVVGSLRHSISEIDRSNHKLAAAADAIGKGDFNVPVHPRSIGDVLGNAISRMRVDLQKFSSENEEKIWLQTGLSFINESIHGDKNIIEVSREAINAIAAYIKTEIGLLYVSNDDVLEYMAGYAVNDTQKIPTPIKFGETLVGQAAVGREMLELKEVAADFIRVSSGAASGSPRHIILLPLVHNGNTEGVLELGTLHSFNASTINLLKQAAEGIAVALHVAKNRERLQELLEETQSQSEELQTQHNELENINAELEAQAHKLQASEEELRVQQEELLHANQELEENTRALEERNQMIMERNTEIQRKAEELALSTKYKSEFLANMSHELRTPLNSILLLSRLLSENTEKNLSGDQVEYARVIQSSGNGLLSLIDEILDLSKIEAGKMELEYTAVMVNEIVQNMKSLFEPIAKDKKLDLHIAADAGIPGSIETDKMRLEQILRNLLSNALKFTTQGSVSLHVSSEYDSIVFSVKDTGIGIPEDKQQLVFEAFQQADGSTRRKFGGTGLGLSISRELARLLGGDIYLTSKPGEGSEFSVKIPTSQARRKMPVYKPDTATAFLQEEYTPVKEAPQQQVQQYVSRAIPANVPDDREVTQPGDKCILIIEDDTPFAKSLLDFTRKQGYKGLVAVRGDDGIELARQYKPVGILLDIHLPVKDGWEVMAELKADTKTRHIPIHTMSSVEFRKESLMKGAINFINKPVAFEQMQDIFKKLEHVLSREQKKVLIVEENARHAKALAYFLESFQVNTEIRHDVSESLSALNTNDVDCVILDMGIPDQRAYEMLEEIKKGPGLENLPIIIFTGKTLSKTEESKIRQYADSIVVKTAQSYKRILDEVSLFLHLVEEHNVPVKENRHRKLGALSEVLEGKTVLIADDDVRNIFSLTKALENLKMKVITAIDGREAIKQLEENPQVDVVLMDMMMPEMDGYQSTATIRKNPKYRTLPIIAVTAKAMSGDREKCISAGASDYITKPVDIDQLLSLLRVWLYDKGI